MIKVGGVFKIKCFNPDGSLAWEDEAKNLVVNAGLQHILDVLFASGTQVDPWYVGIVNASPTPAAGDTMSSHSGWTENTAYSEATRQTYVDVRASQTVTNTASKASFSINADSQSIGGAFLSSSSTKGGTTGTLLCCAPLSTGNKAADSGQTLQIEYQFSASDDAA